MKNNTILFAVIITFLLAFSCKKKDSENEFNSITISIEAAEDAQIFPAEHPLNKDISGDPVDSNSCRLRLKPDFDITSFSETNQIILRALKKYGLILADAGSSMFISGAPNENWDNDDLKDLRNVTVSDCEVIELGDIQKNRFYYKHLFLISKKFVNLHYTKNLYRNGKEKSS